MPKVDPYYSADSEDHDVYHDDSECPAGKRIKPENRRAGKDGRKKCIICKTM